MGSDPLGILLSPLMLALNSFFSGSREIIILEQGEQMIKRSMEHGTILKRSKEQEKNIGASGKIKT